MKLRSVPGCSNGTTFCTKATNSRRASKARAKVFWGITGMLSCTAEPDYSNAKYWFRRIGNQPTYRDLRVHADAVLAECGDPQAANWRGRLQADSKWNPLAFVD